jgi:hypothetical protein
VIDAFLMVLEPLHPRTPNPARQPYPIMALVRELERIERETDGEAGEKLAGWLQLLPAGHSATAASLAERSRLRPVLC